ncbi:MAG: Chromosome partition protein Smc [Candidatus Anoxychlamydiales bacterium]|nr:Chromosome partition protein Smc [Candidatus Anoxychlamydiales bacterium]NGX35198.1 Chromosome partition protein Smc [Candidatus Anoxychlamydiales bacterium]
MKKTKFLIPFGLVLFFSACSPMKSSPKEEKHQMELTLHEVQTNLDDLRHDLNCFQTEMQITNGKVKHQEDATQNLKQNHFEKLQNKIESLTKQINHLENRVLTFDTKSNTSNKTLSELSNHANETTTSLTQYKAKINELEKILMNQNSRIDEIAKIKTTLQDIVKTIKSDSSNFIIYKVKPRDSLEKIAKANNVTVESLMHLNNLENDLIVIGQKLKVPK